MDAKRSLGQHFLKSESVLNTIIDTAKVTPGDLILEIGPGTGVLTKKLLEKGAHVLAIEKDDRLNNFDPKETRLHWIHGDILKFDTSSLSNAKVVANIPYYLSSLILELLLNSHQKFLSITLLVQKEFAEKILFLGSFLSLYTHLFFEPTLIQEVSKEAFSPPPKVTSAILHLKAKPVENEIDYADFLLFAKSISRGKRKTLKNLYPDLPLDKLNFPQTLRLGEISFENLLLLYKNLPKTMGSTNAKTVHKKSVNLENSGL
jgi:16S rRNA (adenine1518-N6/adenine1519-N6)-dimethyltransferase